MIVVVIIDDSATGLDKRVIATCGIILDLNIIGNFEAVSGSVVGSVPLPPTMPMDFNDVSAVLVRSRVCKSIMSDNDPCALTHVNRICHGSGFKDELIVLNP
jgi:hypothetical protein